MHRTPSTWCLCAPPLHRERTRTKELLPWDMSICSTNLPPWDTSTCSTNSQLQPQFMIVWTKTNIRYIQAYVSQAIQLILEHTSLSCVWTVIMSYFSLFHTNSFPCMCFYSFISAFTVCTWRTHVCVQVAFENFEVLCKTLHVITLLTLPPVHLFTNINAVVINDNYLF